MIRPMGTVGFENRPSRQPALRVERVGHWWDFWIKEDLDLINQSN